MTARMWNSRSGGSVGSLSAVPDNDAAWRRESGSRRGIPGGLNAFTLVEAVAVCVRPPMAALSATLGPVHFSARRPGTTVDATPFGSGPSGVRRVRRTRSTGVAVREHPFHIRKRADENFSES